MTEMYFKMYAWALKKSALSSSMKCQQAFPIEVNISYWTWTTPKEFSLWSMVWQWITKGTLIVCCSLSGIPVFFVQNCNLSWAAKLLKPCSHDKQATENNEGAFYTFKIKHDFFSLSITHVMYNFFLSNFCCFYFHLAWEKNHFKFHGWNPLTPVLQVPWYTGTFVEYLSS